jgi:dienelactone hydrolase
MKRTALFFAILLFACMTMGLATADAKVIGKDVTYTADGMTMKGYLAYDDKVKGERPGVIVVHEWWGMNKYTKMRARMLAKLGYAALAIDMYGDGRQATHPEDAKKFSSETMQNFEAAKVKFLAGVDFLKKQPVTDPDQLAAIGYCFGGGVVLNMARQGLDMKGIVSFHGSLGAVKPATPGSVKARIKVYTGGADPFVPPAAVETFRKEMTGAGADFEIVSYPGALHAFTNPEATALGKKFKLPLAYNADGDKESWKAMKKFFAEIFNK